MLLRIVWAGLVAALICSGAGMATAASSGDVAACLRGGGDRYSSPGSAVDDQYSDAAGACQRLIDGGVRVSVSSAAAGGQHPGGGSAGGAPAAAPSGPATAGASGGGAGSASGAPDGTGAPDETGAPAGTGTGSQGAPSAPSAADSVKVALVRADSGAVVARPSAFAHSPPWVLLLGGLVAAGIGVAVFTRARRAR